MTDKKPEAPLSGVFEEWLSFPDKHAFVPVELHHTYSSREGWWVSGAQGDETWVRSSGHTPVVIAA